MGSQPDDASSNQRHVVFSLSSVVDTSICTTLSQRQLLKDETPLTALRTLLQPEQMSMKLRILHLLLIVPHCFRTFAVVGVLATLASAEPPSFDTSVPAWLTVREWMNSGEWPDVDDHESQPSRVGLAGVSTVLRLDGRTVGRAMAFTDEPAILRRATGKAFAQAMSDPAFASLPETLKAKAASTFTLELEFASPPEPLLGRTFAAAIKRLRPGIDGIALRRGESWAYAFPGRMLATATAGSPTSTMLRLAAELGLPPKDLDQLRLIDDVGLYRFETLRLAQAKPTSLPFEVRRAGVTVKTQADPAAFTASIIAHLAHHRVERGSGEENRPAFLGDFNPIADRHDPIEALPRERAMVAWALANAASSTGVPDAARHNARTLAVELLATLPSPPARDTTTALAVLAASALRQSEDPIDEIVERVLREGGEVLLIKEACDDRAFCPLLAAAVASLPTSIENIEERIAEGWRDATPEFMVANLDWLALAERSLARRTGETSERVGLLRDIALMLVARQHANFATADLNGAIPINAQAKHRIDARSLRLGVALQILSDLGAAIPETAHEGMLRFARQLQMSEQDARLHRGYRKGVGGICEAPWDPSQPLASNAIALLLSTENLR